MMWPRSTRAAIVGFAWLGPVDVILLLDPDLVLPRVCQPPGSHVAAVARSHLRPRLVVRSREPLFPPNSLRSIVGNWAIP